MVIVLLIIACIVMYGASIQKEDFNKEYLSKEQTNCIKGLFVLMVFIRHIRSYVAYDATLDYPMVYMDLWMSQLIVAMFLFCSGYGILESYKRKGFSYIKSMPKKRILNVWMQFAAAVFLFFLCGCALGREFSVKQIVLSFIGWDSLGNSNWYVFAILALYIITYVSFSIVQEQEKGVWLNVIGVLMFTLGMSFLKESWWYDTLACYALGLLWSMYKEKVENFFFTHWGKALLIVCAAFLVLKPYCPPGRRYNIIACLFCIILILLSMKVHIGNKILNFFGNHVFSIYILQRLPMIILTSFYSEINSYVFAIISLIVTIIISIIWDKYFLVLLKKISV